MNALSRELLRKSFHMLSLAYLAAYYILGYPRVLTWMIVWMVVVLVIETGRLYFDAFNRFLFSLLGALARDEERNRYSGIVHTTLGALVLFLAFGTRPALVSAGLLCVALGDAVAALVGKTLGRHRLFGSKKSIEGSAACFLTCAAVGICTGFPAGSAVAGATAATFIEALPTTAFFNDNMWMPIVVAGVLRLCAGS